MDILVDTSVLIAVITNEPIRPRLIDLTLDGGLRQAAHQAGVTILEVTP